MYSEFESSDIMDVSDDIKSDVTEPADTTDEIDDMLDGMSLDELYELRDTLTESDVSDTGDEIPDISDFEPIDCDIDEVPDTEDEIPDISDITPIDESESSDYSFHWDGGPTHNTEWDENPEPTAYTKKLTR